MERNILFAAFHVTKIESVMEMLDDIRKTYDLSILMTTHDIRSLYKYADQVYLINKTVISSGKPTEVLDGISFHQVFHRNGGV